MTRAARRRDAFDRAGAASSLLCAVHCAALPIVLALLPSLGLAWWLGDRLEVGFVLFATMFGVAVLGWSWRRHRIRSALAFLIPGLVLLWAGVSYPPLHHLRLAHAVVMTAGGVLVAAAHLANLRLNHCHARACSHAPEGCADT